MVAWLIFIKTSYVRREDALTTYLTTHACRLHARLHPRLHAWTHGGVAPRGIFHLYPLSGLVHKLQMRNIEVSLFTLPNKQTN